MVTAPPSRASTAHGMNHELIPGPVAMASHTSSGVPGTSTDRSMVRLVGGGGLGHVGFSSWGRGWTKGGGAVPAAVRRRLVVVAGDEGAHAGEQVGERCPVVGRAEAHVGVDRQGGQPLAGGVGPGQERPTSRTTQAARATR